MDNFQMFNIAIIEIPGGEEGREKKKICEILMTKNHFLKINYRHNISEPGMLENIMQDKY